jgi:hypothetical protein
MKIDYIENPVIRTHRVKAFVKTLINTGEFDKWAILVSSTTKSERTLKLFQSKVGGYRKQYPQVEWAINHGENNYSIICRKVAKQ